MNIVYFGLTYHFLLALSVWKGCLGQTIDVAGLQAKNGKIAEITWTITVPKYDELNIFRAFKDFCSTSNTIITVVENASKTEIYSQVGGKVKNVSVHAVRTGVTAIKMWYGPVDQSRDNGLKLLCSVATKNFKRATKEVQLEVTNTGEDFSDEILVSIAVVPSVVALMLIMHYCWYSYHNDINKVTDKDSVLKTIHNSEKPSNDVVMPIYTFFNKDAVSANSSYEKATKTQIMFPKHLEIPIVISVIDKEIIDNGSTGTPQSPQIYENFLKDDKCRSENHGIYEEPLATILNKETFINSNETAEA